MVASSRNIDVALLRAFLTVAESGGMTSAASQLNLTQAGVSQQVKRLETILDCQLFDRSQRQLPLTTSGERLLSYARRMTSINDELWNVMTAPAFEGALKLGVPHDIVAVFMPDILRSFGRALPRVQVTLVSKSTPRLISMLEDGRIDVILTTELAPVGEPLLADRLVWAGAPGGEAYRQSPLPIALGDAKCAFRGAAVDALSKANLDWKLMCHTTGQEPIIAVLKADIAVAPILTSAIPEGLNPIPDDSHIPDLPTFYINLRLPAGGVSDITGELVRHIRQGFAIRRSPVG
ncbi:MAG: LysR family transcriptional regulator [Alphaproteobacteria bacterium]|nr:LysR family transcriptional regulator [Alphaproteobacteria bacterium]